MPVARASPARWTEKLRRQRRAWLTASLASVLFGAGEARAVADCSVAAVSLNFASYDPVSTGPGDSVGTVTVTCRHVAGGVARVNYRVTLSDGMNGTSATTRQMAAGQGRLGYNVFADAARTQVWGSGLGGTVIASGTVTVGPGNGNGTRTSTHTLYGRIPQLQDAVPGTYSDTLLVTLTY